MCAYFLSLLSGWAVQFPNPPNPSNMADFESDEALANDFVPFDLLTKVWMNERCAPSLLEYQERLMLHTKEAGRILDEKMYACNDTEDPE